MTVKRSILILSAVGLFIYLNSLFNGFVWDDEEQVLNNILVHSFGNFFQFFSLSTFNTGGTNSLGGIYYKPLMTAFFSLIYSLFGPNPFFFHLFQVSLHIINSIFIFLTLRLLFTFNESTHDLTVVVSSLDRDKKDLLAFILALIFLIHPINTEAVVYVSDLQDILFFFFGIIALWRLITFKLASFKEYIILSVMLLCSLLSKETGVLFYFITGIYVFFFFRKKILLFLINDLISIGIYSILRFLLAGIYFNKHGLAPISTMTFFERLINVPQLICFYFKTFVYPKDLAISQYWVVNSLNQNDFYLPLIISLSAIILLILPAAYFLIKKHHSAVLYIFFLLWFIAGLGMHLHIIFPLDLTVSERWFYFPMVGFLGMLGVLIEQIKIKNLPIKKLLTIFLIITLILFAVRTMSRNSNWKDGLTLYSHDINISKDAFDLENNLGVELYRVGRLDEATIHFGNSTKLAPNWWTNWNNLGVMVERKNQTEAAKKYYQKAIDNGQYYLAYENLAKIYLQNDTPEKAKSFAGESLTVLPNNSNLWFVLAVSEYKLGNKGESLSAAKNAYLLNNSPQNSYLYSRLAQDLPLDFK